jgi:hypothetical protein
MIQKRKQHNPFHQKNNLELQDMPNQQTINPDRAWLPQTFQKQQNAISLNQLWHPTPHFTKL